MLKLIVAGGREFDDYKLLKKTLDRLLRVREKHEVEIVQGEARGADRLGKRYGEENGYKVTPFPADWDRYGNAAGPKRNEEMAQYANACVVFWDQISYGSRDMIKRARKHGLRLLVVHYDRK